MYDTSRDPNAPFLVTTAPRFASKGNWTSSNYLLGLLGSQDTHKRLGDGYYEQMLVMDQILQLTGRRNLSGGLDGLAQYQRLMDGAAAEAARMGLRLGAPLTSTQIASLSQDIVWLVEMEVDGQRVLVPVVYLSSATAERLRNDGALMAGDTVDIQTTTKLNNDGTISGTRGTWLSADTLINDGAISAGRGWLDVTTRGDTVNRGHMDGRTITITSTEGDVVNAPTFDGLAWRGGTIDAGEGGLQVTAARDVVNRGQLTSAGSAGVSAGRDVVFEPDAGVTAGNYVFIESGRDSRFTAAHAEAGAGMAIVAGGSIIADTVTDTATYDNHVGGGRNWRRTTATNETVTGSTFEANGDIAMHAKTGDIDLTAATVRSQDGGVTMVADQGDVNLRSQEEEHHFVEDTYRKDKGTFSSTTTRTHTEVHDTVSVGTTVSGKMVGISGDNILVHGSTVVSDDGTALLARDRVTIEAAENTHYESFSSSKKQSGLFSDGGVGFTIGTSKRSQTADVHEVTHTGSVVGSVDGRVDIYAGGHYQQTGSDVIGNGGVGINAASITVEHAEDSLTVHETQKASSGGLHVNIKGGAADAATSAYGSLKRAGEVQDDRLSALYAVQAAQTVFGPSGQASFGAAGDMLENGAPSKTNNGGMSLRIGIGASSSKSETDYVETTAHTSSIRSANGDVTVIARDGDAKFVGAVVEGVNTTVGAIHGSLIMLSAEEDSVLREKNSAKSGEVGVTFGSEAGVGVYVSANVAKGNGQGDGTTHVETRIGSDRGTTTFFSGGDTIGQGAQIIGEKVVGQVEGDFRMTTEQDTNDYKRKDQSAGIDAAYGIGGGHVDVNYNQAKVNSNYTSAQEQSGVQAGAGGFQIDVKGHTQLDGAAIASTATPDKNSFTTGSLDWSDLKNEAAYKATSAGVSMGGGTQGGHFSPSYATTGDSSSSTTKAGIADGTLVVKDGSGSDIARGATQLQQTGLEEIFDQRKVAETIEMGQVAGQIGFRAVGDYAKSQTSDYENAERDKAIADKKLEAGGLSEQETQYWQQISKQNGEVMAANQAQYDAWKEGSANKAIAHAVAGALSAGLGGGSALDGALGAAAAELARPLTDDENKLVQGLVSLGIGGAAGGSSGASTALSGEVNNRMLHSRATNDLPEVEHIKELSGGDPQREAELWAAACALAKCSAGIPANDPSRAYWAALEAAGNAPERQADRDRLESAVGAVYRRDPTYRTEGVVESGLMYQYGLADAIGDASSRNRVGEYTGRTLQVVGGGAGVVTGLGSCIPSYGAGCVLAAAGVDQMQAGIRGAPTFGGMGLTELGMSPGAAELTYGLLTGAGEFATARLAIASAGAQVEDAAQAAFRNAQGIYGPDGAPLMDFSQLSSPQKMVVGEILGEEKVLALVPDGKFIGRSQGIGETGIDNILQVNRPDVDYVIVEYKFGQSTLKDTTDGMQGSDAWTLGSDRIRRSVGDPDVALDIASAVRDGRIERWVVHTDPAGNVTVGLLDVDGRFIQRPRSALFGGGQ